MISRQLFIAHAAARSRHHASFSWAAAPGRRQRPRIDADRQADSCLRLYRASYRAAYYFRAAGDGAARPLR